MVLITEGTLPHVCKLNSSFRTGVHEPVAASRMKLCRRDDFCQFLHICRFDINNIEALVLDVEIPHVNPKIVTADKCLSITVNRYAVDMVCMGICIYAARYGGNDSVMVGHSRKF